MFCVKTNLVDLLKNWIKEKKNTGYNKDYVYMNWQFEKSHTKEINLSSSLKTIEDLPGLSEFENIQKWLDTQDIFSSCSEIYCDCCDSLDNVKNPAIDMIPSQNNSLSRNNSESALSTCSSEADLDDDYSERSYYSLQIRKKSRTIFSTI